MIATLIRNLTSPETTRRNRTSPRRALTPSIDRLETRLSPGGGWSTPTVYSSPTSSGMPTTPTIVSKPTTTTTTSSGMTTKI
jgi:hypothetical protein